MWQQAYAHINRMRRRGRVLPGHIETGRGGKQGETSVVQAGDRANDSAAAQLRQGLRLKLICIIKTHPLANVTENHKKKKTHAAIYHKRPQLSHTNAQASGYM